MAFFAALEDPQKLVQVLDMLENPRNTPQKRARQLMELIDPQRLSLQDRGEQVLELMKAWRATKSRKEKAAIRKQISDLVQEKFKDLCDEERAFLVERAFFWMRKKKLEEACWYEDVGKNVRKLGCECFYKRAKL
jgi:hypothetical protein